MLHAGGGMGDCQCSSSGLGATPTPSEVEGARRILVGMIQFESNRIAGLADTPAVAAIRAKLSQAVQWSRSAAWRQQDAGYPPAPAKLAEALESATVGIRIMHEVSRAITSLSPADKVAAQAQQHAQAGASFADQVAVAVGLKSPAELYVPKVPGGSIADLVGAGLAKSFDVGKWLLPIGAGVLLLILLRR